MMNDEPNTVEVNTSTSHTDIDVVLDNGPDNVLKLDDVDEEDRLLASLLDEDGNSDDGNVDGGSVNGERSTSGLDSSGKLERILDATNRIKGGGINLVETEKLLTEESEVCLSDSNGVTGDREIHLSDTNGVKTHDNFAVSTKQVNGHTGEGDEVLDVEIETGSGVPNTDVHYHRHRLFHTICVCASVFSLGWAFGMMGPTFPDLRLIMKEDLTTASWIFTGWSFGGLIGSFVGGFAYDRLHKVRLFIGVTLGLGVSVAVAPWCQPFPAMFAVHVIIGIFGGVIKTATTADIAMVWKDDAKTYLQVVHTVVCLGAIISPIVSDPFLAKRVAIVSGNLSTSAWMNSTTDTDHLQDLSTNLLDLKDNLTMKAASLATLITGNKLSIKALDLVYGNTNSANSSVNDTQTMTPRALDTDPVYGDTKIHTSYLFAGLVCLIAASLHCLGVFIYGHASIHKKVTAFNKTNSETSQQKQYFLSKRWKNFFTIIVALAITLYSNSERSFTQFQMTFVISTLKWTKAEGSRASSTFWITFAVGRIISIFIVKKFKLSSILTVYLFLLLCSGVVLWVSVTYDVKLLVWMCIGATGLTMAPIFAGLFSLIAEKIRPLSGKVAGFCFLSASAGGMIFPIILGYLMDNVSEMWFVYFVLLMYISSIACVAFVFVQYMALERRNELSAAK